MSRENQETKDGNNVPMQTYTHNTNFMNHS